MRTLLYFFMYTYILHFSGVLLFYFLISYPLSLWLFGQTLTFLYRCRPLVNLRKADYTEGDRMVEMWAELRPAWIMMWTLIQWDGQRDWGLREMGFGLVESLEAHMDSVFTIDSMTYIYKYLIIEETFSLYL